MTNIQLDVQDITIFLWNLNTDQKSIQALIDGGDIHSDMKQDTVDRIKRMYRLFWEHRRRLIEIKQRQKFGEE